MILFSIRIIQNW